MYECHMPRDVHKCRMTKSSARVDEVEPVDAESRLQQDAGLSGRARLQVRPGASAKCAAGELAGVEELTGYGLQCPQGPRPTDGTNPHE